MKYVNILGSALACLISSASVADTLTAKLHFDTILPFTGILYLPEANAPKQRGILDQKDKRFSSPVVVVSPNSELKIKNSDEFEHNIYADDKQQTGIAFDLGRIPAQEQFRLPVRWSQDSLLRLGCKIHPKMKSYIANIRSQHFVSIPFEPGKRDYELVLNNIPAQLQEVRILLPDLPPLSATLKAGQSRSLTVAIKGREVGNIELSRHGN